MRQKLSARGKYVSVKIGPVQVASSEQVCMCTYMYSQKERPIFLAAEWNIFSSNITIFFFLGQVQAVYNAMRRDDRMKYFL